MIHAFYSTNYNASNRAKSWNKKLIFWKIKMAFLGNRPQIWSIMTRIWGSNILTTYRLRLYTRYYQEVHQVACTIMSRLHYYKFLLALISHGQVQNLPIWVHPKLTWVKGQTDYLPFDWWAGFVVWDHDVIFAFYGSMLGLWDGFSKWCWLEGALVQSELRITQWISLIKWKPAWAVEIKIFEHYSSPAWLRSYHPYIVLDRVQDIQTPRSSSSAYE